MQQKGRPDDGFGPLGICHRLFNFIMNSFLTRGTRYVTLGTNNAALPHDNGSRALEGSRPDQDQVIRPDGHVTSPEIPVEFRHTTGAMVNRSSHASDQVVVQENANTTQTHQKTDSPDQGNSNGGEKVPKRSTLIIKDGGVLPGRRHHLLKTDSPDQGNSNGGEKVPKRSTLVIKDGGDLPGRRHHLLSVASNINEKADAFISSRKEAMEKNLSMKQTTDV